MKKKKTLRSTPPGALRAGRGPASPLRSISGKIRKRWRINPRTRVVKSKKVYSRKKAKPALWKILEEQSK